MIEDRFAHFLRLTGEPTAAAVLVLVEATQAAALSEMLTVEQAAARLGVKVGKVYELCKSGKLRHQRIGRAVRLRSEDVKAYSERGTSGPPAPLLCLKTAS